VSGGRRGTGLAEMLVSLLLGLVLVSVSWRMLAEQRKAVAVLIREGDWLASVRIAESAMRRDVRSAPGVVAVSSDTLGLRVLRGWGLVCATSAPGGAGRGALGLGYRGMRAPDPRRDSLRVVDRRGDFQVVDLVDSGRLPACDTATGMVGYWFVPGDSVAAAYMEVFESGSYHLQARALRYRRSGGSRRPLTPENLGPDSHFDPTRRILELRPGNGPRVWTLRLGGEP